LIEGEGKTASELNWIWFSSRVNKDIFLVEQKLCTWVAGWKGDVALCCGRN